MDSLDLTAYVDDPDSVAYLKIEVGDAKQEDFYPRVKVTGWDNEVNFSLGLATDNGGEIQVEDDGDTIVYSHDDNTTCRFFRQSAAELLPLDRIRRVVAGDSWDPFQATAEYEMFNRIGRGGEMVFAHYVVPTPTICVFDLMPSAEHLNVDEDGQAFDYDYDDKSSYHPADIPIGSYDRVPLVRYYTPLTPFVNPMFMDAGLHNMDCQWHGTDIAPEVVLEAQLTAVETVVQSYGVQTKRHDSHPGKIYFRHGDRWVKFYSGQVERGGLYSYVNIDCAYNKAFDFYRPEIPKDVDLRDPFAYGLVHANPAIDHSIMAAIAAAFARELGVPVVDQPYDDDELVRWVRTQELQNDHDWIVNATRRDANWWRPRVHEGMEFEVVIAGRPATNVVAFTANSPKEVRAHYQAPLPYHAGRPQDVNGSVAVYHATAKHNEYMVGKICHLYRPLAWDSAGLSCWCEYGNVKGLDDGADVDLSDGLTVIVPEWFLDAAVYPVTIDPTFGYTVAGASQIATDDYYASSPPFSRPTGAAPSGQDANFSTMFNGTVVRGFVGTITQLSAWVQDNSVANDVAFQLHDAATGNFVTGTGGITGTGTQGSQVLTTVNCTNVAVSDVDYLIGIVGIGGSGQYGGNVSWGLYYDSNSGKTGKWQDGVGSYSSNLGSLQTDTVSWEASMYATYTAGTAQLKKNLYRHHRQAVKRATHF